MTRRIPNRQARRAGRRLLALGVLVGAGLTLAPFLLASPPDSLGHAIATQRDLLQARPTDGSAWSDLGNLLALDGDRDGAEQAYQEALRLAPELFDAHYNLGVLLLGEERFGPALEHLRDAAAIDPSSAWAQYQIGACLRGQGDRREAIRAFADAFRLEPRLAFPDVNPDVIANPLLTESLLLAHRHQPVRHGAPRVYAEPARIASLLVAPASGGAKAAPAAGAAATAAATESAAAHRSAPAASPIVVPAEPTGATAEHGVPASSVDEDGDAGVDEPSPTDARQLRLVPPDEAERRVFQAPAAVVNEPAARRRVGPGDLSAGGAIDPAEAPAAQEPAQNPVTRFRPGRRSSAQLELQLVPRGASNAPALAGAAAVAFGIR